MAFIHEDFLLGNKPARRLYHKFAEAEPIFDYHCHISPKDIAENRQFKNLFEIWLEGDHYKWRAMRSNGVAEKFCHRQRHAGGKIQGLGQHRAAHAAQSALSLDASGTEALFRHHAICSSEKTAAKIWKQANAKLATPGAHHAGHPEKIQGQGRLHHGRSGG